MTNLFTNLSNWKVKYICALLMFVCVGVGTAWGASESVSTDLAKSSYSNADKTRTWTMTSCTVVQAKGSGTEPNYSYPGRWYQNNVITFTPGADYSITKIVLIGTSSYKGQTMTTNKGSISTNSSTYTSTWTGPSKSAFTITMGTQFRFGSVTIHYCYNPKSLTNTTIGSTTATLSWTDTHNVGSYEVYRSTSSTAPAANATPTTTVSEKSVELTGLTASTTYYWWVRSKCANDCKSEWIAGTSFTTSAAAVCSADPMIGSVSLNGSFFWNTCFMPLRLDKCNSNSP